MLNGTKIIYGVINCGTAGYQHPTIAAIAGLSANDIEDYRGQGRCPLRDCPG